MEDAMGVVHEEAVRRTRPLDPERRKALIAAVAEALIVHADELTALDQAIGAEAVLKDLGSLAAMQLPDLLRAIGMKLVATVGGASGPLYGTLFLALGKALPAEASLTDALTAFGTAIAAVKARGKSDVGQKTMLDVLIPVHEAMMRGADAGAIKESAARAAEATVPMRATRGRASFLGERSIGHMDPGARSSWLMIAALCDAFGES
jgi:dihydroxyacetone kinase-like protein